MMSLTNKIDFAVVFRVRNANPNGDPLNGNRPRTTYEGLGELTDVCLKRKIRDRLLESGLPIFVQSDDNRVDDHVNLRSRADTVLSKTDGNRNEAIRLACQTWFDVRAFGQVFPFKGIRNQPTARGLAAYHGCHECWYRNADKRSGES